MALIASLRLCREHILASGKEGTASDPQNPDTSRPQFLSKRIDVKTRKSRAAVTTTTTSMTTLTPNVPRPGGSPGTAPAAPPEIPPWLQQDEDEKQGNGMLAGQRWVLKETVASVPGQKHRWLPDFFSWLHTLVASPLCLEWTRLDSFDSMIRAKNQLKIQTER